MSKRLKNKLKIMVLVEIISVLLLGGFLLNLQTALSVRNQETANEDILNQIEGLMQKRETDAEQIRESYDEVYIAKAQTAAFMARKITGFAYTDTQMRQWQTLFQVDNLLILDAKGQVLATAVDQEVDYSISRYNQLRQALNGTEPSKPFDITQDGVAMRYYGARIDADKMVVIVQNPQEMDELLERSTSVESIFGKISVGLSGYALAVSHTDYAYLYHPDETMIGRGAPSTGLTAGILKNQQSGWVTVNGERLFISSRLIDDVYAVCAIPQAEIHASRLTTVIVTLLAFMLAVTLVIAYAMFIQSSHEHSSKDKETNYRKVGPLYYNRKLGRKILTVSSMGLIAIIVVSMFMQTLFALSRQTMSDRHPLETILKNNEENKEEVKVLTEQYNTRYLNKCQVLAEILKTNPELQSEESLAELSRVLGVENIWVFDKNGHTVATDSPFWDFTLSTNPEEQSYEFRSLMKGYVDYLIQDAKEDEVSGELRQYIGVTMRTGEEHEAGFVEICIAPEKLQNLLDNMSIGSLLSGVKVGSQGFAFAVRKSDHTFAYYPDEKLIDRSVYDYGLTDFDLHDGFEDFITIRGTKYYCSSEESENYYLYVAIPSSKLTRYRLPIALVTAAGSFLCLLLIGLILSLSKEGYQAKPKKMEEAGGNEMVDVVMPDGGLSKTVAAAKRWSGDRGVDWEEKTPEQKLLSLLGWLISVLAVGMLFVIAYKDYFFEPDSVMHYILGGEWERSFNLFAITNAIILFVAVNVASAIVRRLLMFFSKTFGARGETVCRLLDNVIKYFTILALLYYCLGMFGVDTKTLLASAGIMSVIIGLGSQALISDILAGLFIVFEGEFRVGDIVTIGDWRGTVMEIGVRTTKIKDASNNIKIISNSSVTGVINMTKQFSFASCDVGIEYGESLERVESVLREELPHVKERLPAIVEGPFYKGVVALGDSSVDIRLVAKCAEGDRVQLIRDLNREIKLLFDKYDIGIPFPQVVVNQPVEFAKATMLQKLQSEAFVTEQKEKVKDLGETVKSSTEEN
ncbi:MAG: mechanosensitive ion channel family protein [Lachnospiraceae bacterium]|nr:mechanosensitive ion channel family protein [Lachnospiraceae bacterium]